MKSRDPPTHLNELGHFGSAAPESGGNGKASALTDFESVKHIIHSKLVSVLNFEEVRKLTDYNRRTEIRKVVVDLVQVENPPLGPADRESLIEQLLNDTLGLGPLEELLRDPNISDILINGPHEVYVERHGRLTLTDVGFKDDAHLMQVIDRIVSRVGRRIDETSPTVDARLQDGSRVHAIIPPLALKGPTVSIRRFGAHHLRLADLLRHKAFTAEMSTFMEAAVKARLNILISGGTGSGKTTLLNCLSSFIPSTDRIITIEDAAELRLQQPHVVTLEARPANIEGKGQVTIRELVRNALRMRPDRIVVGECRGPEALDMLQAMNTGHEGSMTTLHANTPRDTLARLETMIMMSGVELPIKAMRQQIASAINLIIQTNRLQGGSRRITSITEIVGMEGDVIVAQDLFQFQQQGIDVSGKAEGRFRSCGVRSTYDARIRAAGITLPANLFEERVLLEG